MICSTIVLFTTVFTTFNTQYTTLVSNPSTSSTSFSQSSSQPKISDDKKRKMEDELCKRSKKGFKSNNTLDNCNTNDKPLDLSMSNTNTLQEEPLDLSMSDINRSYEDTTDDKPLDLSMRNTNMLQEEPLDLSMSDANRSYEDITDDTGVFTDNLNESVETQSVIEIISDESVETQSVIEIIIDDIDESIETHSDVEIISDDTDESIETHSDNGNASDDTDKSFEIQSVVEIITDYVDICNSKLNESIETYNDAKDTIDNQLNTTPVVNEDNSQVNEQHCTDIKLENCTVAIPLQRLTSTTLDKNQIREKITELKEMKNSIVLPIYKNRYFSDTVNPIRLKLYMSKIRDVCIEYANDKGEEYKKHVEEFNKMIKRCIDFDTENEMMKLYKINSWDELVKKYVETKDIKMCHQLLSNKHDDIVKHIKKYIEELEIYVDSKETLQNKMSLQKHMAKKQELIDEINAYNVSAKENNLKNDIIGQIRYYCVSRQCRTNWNIDAKKTFSHELKLLINNFNKIASQQTKHKDRKEIVQQIGEKLTKEVQGFFKKWCKGDPAAKKRNTIRKKR